MSLFQTSPMPFSDFTTDLIGKVGAALGVEEAKMPQDTSSAVEIGLHRKETIAGLLDTTLDELFG